MLSQYFFYSFKKLTLNVRHALVSSAFLLGLVTTSAIGQEIPAQVNSDKVADAKTQEENIEVINFK